MRRRHGWPHGAAAKTCQDCDEISYPSIVEVFALTLHVPKHEIQPVKNVNYIQGVKKTMAQHQQVTEYQNI